MHINDLINEKALIKSNLDSIETEFKHFKVSFNDSNNHEFILKSFYNLKPQAINKLMISLEMKLGVTLFQKIMNLFLYGIYDFSIYKLDYEMIIENLKLKFYQSSIEEYTSKIKNIDMELEKHNYKELTELYIELSMKLFKDSLASKYKGTTRNKFEYKDFYRNTNEFLNEYPVVLSTTHSLRTSTNPNHLYDYLIIDESSQVDIVTGALAISCAKNVIIVGDDKQLPNVVTESVKQETDAIFNEYELEEMYRYSNHSFLASSIEVFKDAPRILLREHYRCHSKIIDFCNKKFYNNQLIMLNNNEDRNPIFAYKTVEGNHAREHYNQRQIDVIVNEILNSKNVNIETDSIGIITPYVKQKEELRKIINRSNVEIDTIHKFQGREKDIIIISTVDDDNNDFSENPNLLNVAISRAIKKLFIVVPNKYSNQESNMSSLIKYIEYNNMTIVDSKIYSIFDYLYKSYDVERKKLLSRYKDNTRYDSELLMENLILKTLYESKIDDISYIPSYPLKSLIKDSSLLDKDEYQFVYKTNSHNDFILYNIVTKEPFLALEVDGYEFHENNSEQLERDRKKDIILSKYNIPIMRFKTNHSLEEERLKKMIIQIKEKRGD
jgi:hypothetical protein